MYIKLYYIFNKNIFVGLDNFNSVNLSFLKNQKIVDYIYKNIVKFLSCILIKNNYIHIFLKDCKFLKNVVLFLKNNLFLSVDQLLDFTIVDRLENFINKNYRFEFVYVFVSTSYNYRIFVRGFLSLFDSLDSISNFFNSANWLEREVWDMYGVFIKDNKNLRRILTDYGFNGFPLRKDFPLTGYVELRYDDISKSIVIEPLELSQEYRFFKLEIPWRK